MRVKLFDLFPVYPIFPQIEIITWAAEQYVQINNCSTVTMAHMVYGYMYCMNTVKNNKYPWIISPKAYTKKIKPIKSNKQTIETDVLVLADWYNKLFSSESVIDADEDEGLDFFYLLINYLRENKLIDSSFYFPQPNYDKEYVGDFNLIMGEVVDGKAFGKSENFNNALLKALENKNYFSNYYSLPVKIEHTSDLTHQAFKNELNSFIGRETELKRLITILTRMIKNNAILIGEPGVGKTSIVEALAIKLVQNKVPRLLREYHILELDLGSTLSGTKYRGDFENRIKKLLKDIKESEQKIVLFIDEIHLIIGLGRASEGDALGLSDILKPYMTNPNFKIIGTSTFKEFKKFEEDKALMRRVDTITVEEPSLKECFNILKNKKSEFEENYGFIIPDSTLKSIIELSNRFIPERFLPDKAINILDDACSIKFNYSLEENGSKLSIQDALKSISALTGIPIDKLSNFNNYANLLPNLSSKIIGQEKAITSLANAIKRTQAGLNDEKRPLASFMFIGPTGVGKTEAAKTLADFVFSGRENMIRFDMSEYMEEHSVSKLIGSPPGYVGFETGGLLTDKVHRHPFSLVLFDEIEKAHPKIFNLLLQILDEGCLTNSHGEKINFKNTIIILTSNVGISSAEKLTGFGNKTSSKSQNIMSAVKNKFPPEFLNRLDEIILFNYLTEEDILKITELYISTEIISKLNARNIFIDITDEVIREIAKRGYKEEYGARELKRVVVTMLKNPLADFIIENPKITKILVDLDGDKVKFSSKELICI